MTVDCATACKRLVVYTFYNFRDFVDSFTFTAMSTWPCCITDALTLSINTTFCVNLTMTQNVVLTIDRTALLCVLTKCQKFHFRWAEICIWIDANFKIVSGGKPPDPH